MRILVLGGTSFVGRAIVEDALRTGAEVTLFRGKTGTDLFPQLTLLRGDRDTGDYAALAGRLAEIISGEAVALIETLAQRLAAACLADERVQHAEITVHKPDAPVGVPLRDVTVTIRRSRG